VQFESVVDFGCGVGGWLLAAKQLGATKVLGIEGDWVQQSDLLIEKEELSIKDLRNDVLNLSRAYDLCMSIEVAEHLPKESADLFCDNLTNASNFIVFSAAIPGQGGIDHINEQPPKYWVDKFWQRGFVPLEIIRPAIINEPQMYAWLKQNLIVFMNHDITSYQHELARFMMPRSHFYHRYWPL
jgi:cyclopropane fatty-acyl-phospholipid synthase-like methyltransferase